MKKMVEILLLNRPIVVIKKFNKNLALVVPTSKQLKDNPFYIKINYKNSTYSALISHLRSINSKRLQNKIAQLTSADFEAVKTAIRNLI